MMNAGIYFFKKKILKKINSKTFSIEDEIVSDLIRKNDLNGIYINSFFIDIGTKNNLYKLINYEHRK
jgi:NDP-sugar pyrophosphorylase family protein